MKKAIIIGATSGIGQEVAKCLLLDGWQIGVAGRRQSALENLQRAAPDQIQIQNVGRNPGRCRREIEYAHRQGGRHGFVSS